MLERATKNTAPALPQAVGQTAIRFSRDPSEFTSAPTPLTLVPNAESEDTR
ncbi:Protein of unknown function, possible transposase fragment [Mycobacterium canettii CIPT 140070017]|nr:Protein of unknown function, possible transposase fragment [Mycobacterium canettii CIPT 140070017]